jgi:hypothetical protein
MSDLHYFRVDDPATVQREFAEFFRRCDLILAQVFDRREEIRTKFREWLEERIRNSDDPTLILHDEPLYVSARYIGANLEYAHSPAIEKKYLDLARRFGWLPP